MSAAIWHDVECGSYVDDLPLWRSLAAQYGEPVLDVGAGTGRVALDLARSGFRVVALDRDPELLAELERRTPPRASGRNSHRDVVSSQALVTTVVADARAFDLPDRFRLVIVPMQTIQLLGGRDERAAFLRCAHEHLHPGGALAVAIAEVLDLFVVTDGGPAPLPDIREHDGTVYSSQPTAVRADNKGFVLERRRETVAPAGERTVEEDVVRLDRLTVKGLEKEAAAAGFKPTARVSIPPTDDYSGSEVVIARA